MRLQIRYEWTLKPNLEELTLVNINMYSLIGGYNLYLTECKINMHFIGDLRQTGGLGTEFYNIYQVNNKAE